jgi:hypothetical protein
MIFSQLLHTWGISQQWNCNNYWKSINLSPKQKIFFTDFIFYGLFCDYFDKNHKNANLEPKTAPTLILRWSKIITQDYFLKKSFYRADKGTWSKSKMEQKSTWKELACSIWLRQIYPSTGNAKLFLDNKIGRFKIDIMRFPVSW